MKNPSQNSVTLLCRVGRVASSWAAVLLGAAVSASQTNIPSGANNGGSGYTLTFTPDGHTVQTATNINIDNNATDGFFEFTVGGLSAGNEVTGTLSIDTGAGVLTSIPFTLKTLPAGEVRKTHYSCAGFPYDSDMFSEADHYTYLNIARMMVDLGADYCSVIDDFLYMGAGTLYDVPFPWSPPKNVASDSPHIIDGAGGQITSTDILATDFDRSTATDTGLMFLHANAANFLNPAVQYIGQRMPMNFRAGDHDFMPGNDADHTGRVAGSSITDEVNVRAIARAHWATMYGFSAGATSYASAPSTAEYPSALLPTPATHGAVDANYLPDHWYVDTDYVRDFNPDFLSHRSPRGEDLAGSTLLGATQKIDLETALTSVTKSFINISSAKQLFSGITNNADGYVANIGGVKTPSATVERGALITHMQGLGRAISVFCGDSHTLQNASLDNIAEFNIAPSARSTDVKFTSVDQQIDALGNLVTLDDLFNDSGMALDFSGQFDSWAIQGVRQQAQIAGTGYGFGYSRYTRGRGYHATIDQNGCVVGGIVEMAANNPALYKSSAVITDSETGIMIKMQFLLEAQLEDTSANYIGGGWSPGDNLCGMMSMVLVEGESGSGYGNSDNYCAINMIADKDTATMGQGFAISLIKELWNSGLNPTATGGSFPDTINEWPEGLVITVEVASDGSNKKSYDVNTVWDGIYAYTGSNPFYVSGVRLQQNADYGFVVGEEYLVTLEMPESVFGAVAGGGPSSAVIADGGSLDFELPAGVYSLNSSDATIQAWLSGFTATDAGEADPVVTNNLLGVLTASDEPILVRFEAVDSNGSIAVLTRALLLTNNTGVSDSAGIQGGVYRPVGGGWASEVA